MPSVQRRILSCQRVTGVGSMWNGAIIVTVVDAQMEAEAKRQRTAANAFSSPSSGFSSALSTLSSFFPPISPPLILFTFPFQFLLPCSSASPPLSLCLTTFLSLTVGTRPSLLLASWPLWCSWLKSRCWTPWWSERPTSLLALWSETTQNGTHYLKVIKTICI